MLARFCFVVLGGYHHRIVLLCWEDVTSARLGCYPHKNTIEYYPIAKEWMNSRNITQKIKWLVLVLLRLWRAHCWGSKALAWRDNSLEGTVWLTCECFWPVRASEFVLYCEITLFRCFKRNFRVRTAICYLGDRVKRAITFHNFTSYFRVVDKWLMRTFHCHRVFLRSRDISCSYWTWCVPHTIRIVS